MGDLVAVLVIELAVLVELGFLFHELLAPNLLLFMCSITSRWHILLIFMQSLRNGVEIHGFLREGQELLVVVHPLDQNECRQFQPLVQVHDEPRQLIFIKNDITNFQFLCELEEQNEHFDGVEDVLDLFLTHF